MGLLFFLYLAAMCLLPHFSRLCQLLQLPFETMPATRVLESSSTKRNWSQPYGVGVLFVLEVQFALQDCPAATSCWEAKGIAGCERTTSRDAAVIARYAELQSLFE